MTKKQLMELLSKYSDDAVVTVQATCGDEIVDAVTKDVVDISAETENGNTICIIAAL
jgi:hypothetical protein